MHQEFFSFAIAKTGILTADGVERALKDAGFDVVRDVDASEPTYTPALGAAPDDLIDVPGWDYPTTYGDLGRISAEALWNRYIGSRPLPTPKEAFLMARALPFAPSVNLTDSTAVGIPTIKEKLIVGPAGKGQPGAPLLNPDELAALHRFDECAADGAGYDVPKQMMQRLAEIGVVRRRSGFFYQTTEFGMAVLGQVPEAPKAETRTAEASDLVTAFEGLVCKARWTATGCAVSPSSVGDDLVLRKDALFWVLLDPDLKRQVNALPSVVWWHDDGHVVFNNFAGDDLLYRKDLLAIANNATGVAATAG